MIIHAWENGETIELTEEEKQGYINYDQYIKAKNDPTPFKSEIA